MKTLLESDIKIHLFDQMKKNNIHSIQELHKATGLSRTTISDLLNGKKKMIRMDTIFCLCKVLNCKIGDLIEINQENAGA